MEHNEEYIQELYDEINSLKDTISDLRDNIIDLNNHIDNCKQTELIEFVKDIKSSIQMELTDIDSTRTKEEILNNLYDYVQDFIKNNKIK